MFPCQIPDLSSESPFVVSGRYRGTFPKTLKLNGRLGDMSGFTLDLNVEEAKEIPISKVIITTAFMIYDAYNFLKCASVPYYKAF